MSKNLLFRNSCAVLVCLAIAQYCSAQFSTVYSTSGTQYITDFEFSTADVGVASGVSLFPPFISFVSRSDDGGQNWTLVDSLPGQTGARNVFAVSADTFFISGHVSNHDAWLSTNGGLSWGFTPRFSNLDFEQGWFFDSERALMFWTLVSGFEFSTYTSDGFNTANDGLDSLNCQGVGYVEFPNNKNIGYVVCTLPSELKRTNDGGFDWTTIWPDIGPFSFLNDSVGYLLSWDNRLFKTEDYAETISFIADVPEGISTQNMLFLNLDTGFIVGSDTSTMGIGYRTENGGLSWTRMDIPPCPSVIKIVCTDEVNGTCLINAQRHIMRTENWGGVYTPPSGLEEFGNGIDLVVVQSGNTVVISLGAQEVGQGGTFFVYDLLGRKVHEDFTRSASHSINDLQNGWYIFRYRGDGFQVAKVFAKN